MRLLWLFPIVSASTTRAFCPQSSLIGSRRATAPSSSRSPTQVAVIPVPLESYSALISVSVSPEPIHTAFSVATFLPQPFWLLMILLPNAKITKKIMTGLGELIKKKSVPYSLTLVNVYSYYITSIFQRSPC